MTAAITSEQATEGTQEAITLDESKRLIQLETTIKAGIDTFVQVGDALLEIRDSRLYRSEHGTFESYCREKWGMGIRFAQMQIAGSKVVASLSDANHGSPIPTTERQARPLTKLSPEKQIEAWAKSVEIADGNQPAAKQVIEAVKIIELVPKEPDPIEPKQSAKFGSVVIDCANRIWIVAKSQLDKITKEDVSRERVLKIVIAYAEARLARNK